MSGPNQRGIVLPQRGVMRRVTMGTLPLAKAMVFPFMAATCDMFWQGISRNASVFWQFNASNIYNYL
jgi:hypothetical protein